VDKKAARMSRPAVMICQELLYPAFFAAVNGRKADNDANDADNPYSGHIYHAGPPLSVRDMDAQKQNRNPQQ
jgi:hypothetical protein